jgi:hypothetical protein
MQKSENDVDRPVDARGRGWCWLVPVVVEGRGCCRQVTADAGDRGLCRSVPVDAGEEDYVDRPMRKKS